MALWNLLTKSLLQRVRQPDGSLKLYPFRCFLAHDHAVSNIQWCKANRWEGCEISLDWWELVSQFLAPFWPSWACFFPSPFPTKFMDADWTRQFSHCTCYLFLGHSLGPRLLLGVVWRIFLPGIWDYCVRCVLPVSSGLPVLFLAISWWRQAMIAKSNFGTCADCMNLSTVSSVTWAQRLPGCYPTVGSQLHKIAAMPRECVYTLLFLK